MLANYISTKPDSRVFYGKSLSLPGSLKKDEIPGSKIIVGDLTAILTENTPSIVRFIRRPHKKIALIPDYEEKIAAICKGCSEYNITNFAGVPSWNLKLLNQMVEYNKVSSIKELWPNLELYMHGGVNFESYRSDFKKIIGDDINYLENYNASEGYFAYQDDLSINAMRLALGNGVFYEFIPLNNLNNVIAGLSDEAYTLAEVKPDITYALVISTNSGLWRYIIGDSVKFVSTFPHRMIITGRTKLYINVFGEELMINNAEIALAKACKIEGLSVLEYTVAPVYMTLDKKGYHQWAIEFSENIEDISPSQIDAMANTLDAALCEQNSDYEAKRKGGGISRLEIIPLKKGTFYTWLSSKGKVGAQNKVPRLYNDRTYIDQILSINS